MSQKRKRPPEQPEEASTTTRIFRSTPITDRASTFQGLYSPTLKPKDLQNLPDIATADHKILAWRKESNQQSITGAVKFTPGHDDDGEKYGGKKVERVLERMDVAGACVVARWYGGVLLGPVRFEHIETCATEAVKAWRDAVEEEKTKKRRVEEEAVEKERLGKVLVERDGSIAVLRALAAEKEEAIKAAAELGEVEDATAATRADGAVENPKAVVAEVKPAVDYSKMPLEVLKKHEKARDATLAFLLKRIDKAEADLKAAQKSSLDNIDPNG